MTHSFMAYKYLKDLRKNRKEYAQRPEVKQRIRERYRRYALNPIWLKRQREHQRKYRSGLTYKRRISKFYKSKEYHEYHHNYYLAHREKILAAHKTPRVRQRQRLYRRRPYIKKRDLAYRNIPKVRRRTIEVTRIYNKTPAQKERMRIWFKSPKGILHRQNLTHLRRGADKPISFEDYQKVWKKTKNSCRYCKVKLTKKNKTIDHAIPLIPRKGEPKGNNDLKNLWPACRSCNFSKGNMSVKVFTKLLHRRQTLWSNRKQSE